MSTRSAQSLHLAKGRRPFRWKARKHQVWTLPKNRKNIATNMKRLGAVGLAMLLAASGTAASVKSPLADAAEKSDRAGVRTLLKQHADVNAPQVDGMTALHWAAYQDDLETAKLLLKAGANVKAENRYGVTPLSLACQNGNGELVESLLTAGADPNTTLHGGGTGPVSARRPGKGGPGKGRVARRRQGGAQEKGGGAP